MNHHVIGANGAAWITHTFLPKVLAGCYSLAGISRVTDWMACIVHHGTGHVGGGSSPPARIWLAVVKGCSAVPRLRTISRGRAVWQARRVHTLKVAGSNPAFAICRERILNQLDGENTVQRAPVDMALLLCQLKEGQYHKRRKL